MAGSVARINVTPVKGLALGNPESVELTPSGARDDRRFFLVSADGRLVNGKRIGGGLGLARTDWDSAGGVLSVTLPGGEIVCDVVRLGRETTTDIYTRPVAGHEVDGPFGEALSDLAGMPVTLIERAEQIWATDSRPASLISQASLDEFGGDGRRFRMLLELVGLDAYEEDSWSGSLLQVGEITLEVGPPTPRCVLPSFGPDDAVRDRDMLRDILAERGPIDGQPCLGVFAEVIEPGVVRVGDAVELV
jgi:uncharacterized protein